MHAVALRRVRSALRPAARTCFVRVPGGCTSRGVLLGRAIGAQNPVPEEVDDCEIAVRVAVVDEMQLLHMPEPAEPKHP